MTTAERLLLLLVADALIATKIDPDSARFQRRLAAARHALDDEAHSMARAATQEPPHGEERSGQGLGSGDAINAAQRAHSPATGLLTPTEAERRRQGDAWLQQQRRDFAAGGIDAA